LDNKFLFSKVNEILLTKKYIITLNEWNSTHVFNILTGEFLGSLNLLPTWDVKNLLINFSRKSVIVIYTNQTFNSQKTAFEVVEVEIKCLGNFNSLDNFLPIFIWENIVHPGYIEFDEPTKMAVTKSINPITLKIWSL